MRLATWITGILLLTIPSLASADVLALYSSGELAFEFDEFPFGSLTGTFGANGDVLDLSGFPPSGSGAAMGLVADTDSTDYFVMVAGVRNADGSVDLAFLHIRADVGVGPGTYPVDPVNQRVLVGFIDNGRGVDMPEDLVGYDYTQWMALIDADHKFIGALGNVVVSRIGATVVEGSFDGIMADISGGALISVKNSMFRLASEPTPVDDESWGAIKGRYQE